MQKKDFVSLAEARPDLAAEWNYEKNGNLRPEDVTCKSGKKVWWKLPYDVPMDYKVEKLSGKHFEFEWEATISGRSRGDNCPYLSGRAAAWEGFNDLQTVKPELAKQWHPTKNGNLKPNQITSGSNKEIWWLFPYDDHKTGKHFDFEWKNTVKNRNKNLNCPYLTGYAVWEGFNDLQTVNPEFAKQWHPTRNGNLKPNQVVYGSNKKVWWLLPYDDPKTGKHFDFEWKASIDSRIRNNIGCPYLSNRAVWKGFNDLQTTNAELAKQWHPIKNGKLKPTQITCGSEKKVWWLFPYDDPETGNHFDFEWQESIVHRNNNINCPYLMNQAVWPGFNDLQTINPKLAEQWHPVKNGDLKPTDVTAGSGKRVWWLLPYDDIKTGKHFDFEWSAVVRSRNNGNGCPYLSGHAVWEGFNDLQTINPELAKQWHPIKNGNLKPNQVTSGSNKKIWWLLLYDDPKTGKHFDFEWKASIDSRMSGKYCPFLSGQAVWPGFNDLETVNPELAKQWHPTKNGNLKPNQVTYGSKKKVWWLFPYDDIRTGKHYDFEWTAEIKCRNKNSNCPFIAMSYGEELVKKYLNNMDINFKIQHRFSDLIGTGGRQLSYDFSIPSEKYGLILIEYNGLQHYQSCEFFGGEEKFKKQKEHDRLKKEYAKKHGYKLIIVKYTYDTHEDVAKYLEKELKKSDESVFDSASKTRLHQISNGNSPFFVDEMNGEDIKTAEKEAIKESTKKNKEKIGEIEEETGENIVCNKEENVA